MNNKFKLIGSEYIQIFAEDNNIKNKIIVLWISFLNDGFSEIKFDKKLYAYLCLHGGFPIVKDKESFYNEYFKECRKAKILHSMCIEFDFMKWLHIVKYFYSSRDGMLFSENLYSDWNNYGSYSDLNIILKKIYKDFMINISDYLKQFENSSENKVTLSKSVA